MLTQDSSSVPFLTEMFLDMSMGNAMDVGYHAGDLVVKELKKVTKLHKKKACPCQPGGLEIPGYSLDSGGSGLYYQPQGRKVTQSGKPSK